MKRHCCLMAATAALGLVSQLWLTEGHPAAGQENPAAKNSQLARLCVRLIGTSG